MPEDPDASLPPARRALGPNSCMEALMKCALKGTAFRPSVNARYKGKLQLRPSRPD
jgi:hypothetical protein